MRYRARKCRRPVTQLDGPPECWRVFDRVKKVWSTPITGGKKTSESLAKALNAKLAERCTLTWQDERGWV